MHNLRINIHTLTHVRNALCCDACFAPDAGFGVERAGIGIAQPFTVGPGYHAASTRFALVGINPGSGNESWKEARAEALFRFKAATTDQQRRTALQSFFDAFLTDLPNFSVPSPAMLMSHLPPGFLTCRAAAATPDGTPRPAIPVTAAHAETVPRSILSGIGLIDRGRDSGSVSSPDSEIDGPAAPPAHLVADNA
jgi:hypothetical protein